MNLSDADWERLERYVTRRGTADELAELERWVSGSAELRAIVRGMRAAGRPDTDLPPWDEELAWRRVSRRMRWFSRPILAPIGWRRRVPWAAAAAILLALGATATVQWNGTRARGAAEASPPPREVATRRGERAAFGLPDGTRVVLGTASRLVIPASYGRRGVGRDVELEGEAYFEVTHDSLRPFRVHTALGIAEDLGTEFVVTTQPEARGMRVVVASGVVALRRPARAGRATDSLPLMTLTRGDLARLDSAGTATVTRVDPDSYLQWTRGVLQFRGTPLGEALPQLARWYDVDLRLATPQLGTRRLTATFRDQSIDQVLNLIALSLDLRVERAGTIVTLHPSPPSTRRP